MIGKRNIWKLQNNFILLLCVLKKKLVYLIQSLDSGKYKIGISNNPTKRIKNLQTGNGEKLKLIHMFESNFPSKLEKALHNKFSHLKLIGEWYNLTLEDECNFIYNCKKIENNLNTLVKYNNNFI